MKVSNNHLVAGLHLVHVVRMHFSPADRGPYVVQLLYEHIIAVQSFCTQSQALP